MKRAPVGKPLEYRGHTIQPAHMGPDLICYVDGSELPHFYLNAEAARIAGRRYVDQLEKEAKRTTS